MGRHAACRLWSALRLFPKRLKSACLACVKSISARHLSFRYARTRPMQSTCMYSFTVRAIVSRLLQVYMCACMLLLLFNTSSGMAHFALRCNKTKYTCMCAHA